MPKMLASLALLACFAPALEAQIVLNEIRSDQPGVDNDEYVELQGPPGSSLDGLTYVVIGDSGAAVGIVEAVLGLTGQTLDGAGFFVVAEATFSLGAADLTASLNLENTDNVTHLLVTGFTGAVNDDLDGNDDGILDVTPWTSIVDCVAVLHQSPGGDTIYCATTVGPDAGAAPGHVFRCGSDWLVGDFDPTGGDDTPGAENGCPTAGCLETAVAESCAVLRTTLGPTDVAAGDGLVVVHYNTGTTPGMASPSNVAFVEILGAQLASSQTLPDPENHALNAVLPASTSNGTNFPPSLATLDSMTSDFGEPGFGGAAAAWSLDRYDGANAPGVLAGSREHTLLFGAAAGGVCTPDNVAATELGELELVLRIEAGIRHSVFTPEVDLVQAAAWDGAAFTVPVPGAFPLQPFVLARLALTEVGISTSSGYFSGSADPGFVRVLRLDECALDGFDFVAESNLLTLGLPDAQTCYTEDALVCFELRMSCLDQQVTGFFATVEFDPALLDLDPASAYTNTPFQLHILPIADAGGGRLLLDGSVDFGEDGVDQDALLATLCFRVRPGNDGATTAVGFSTVRSFPNELSFEGLPIATQLGLPPAFGIDQTPPSIVCPPAVSVPSAPASQCSAVVVLTPPTASDDCGVRSIEAVRSDGRDLSAPYPAGCSPGALTQVTWTVTDCAGLTASCIQNVRVIDSFTGGPLIFGLPQDITVPAEAGTCSAVVTYTDPTATDNCDADPTVTCIPPSGSVFPAGPNEVVCQAIDSCGNAVDKDWTVTVLPESDATATVELVGVYVPVTRCIHFVAGECAGGVDVELDFVDHDGDDLDLNGLDDMTGLLATPVRATDTFRIPCGAHTELCAKDEQHTLWDTTPLSVTGTTFTADNVLSLHGGDADDDGDVDLSDIAVFLSQYGDGASAGGCPWDGTQDADFSNDTVIGAEDYAFLTASFLATTSCSCTMLLKSSGTLVGGRGGSVSVALLPAPLRQAADRDQDGTFDFRDLELFEREHGLASSLSGALRSRSRER